MLHTPSPSPSTSQAPLPWRLLQIFNRSVSQKVTVHVCIADGNHGGPGKSRKFGLTVLSIFCPVYYSIRPIVTSSGQSGFLHAVYTRS